MSALREMPVVIDMVKRLSQEEGLKDHEIAAKMNVSRETIQRIRKANNISSANLKMRLDKEYKCIRCGKVDYVRRNERKPTFCSDCIYEINNNIPMKTKEHPVNA